MPFILSGKAAVNLLELGLSMKFKTDRAEDAIFVNLSKIVVFSEKYSRFFNCVVELVIHFIKLW